MPPSKGIYAAIEEILKKSDDALTAIDLWEVPTIRQYVKHVDDASDTLGQMWRRGYLHRTPAPKDPTSQVKWQYSWGRTGKKPRAEIRAPVEPDPPAPAPAPAPDSTAKVAIKGSSTIARVETTHHGNEIVVRITLDTKK